MTILTSAFVELNIDFNFFELLCIYWLIKRGYLKTLTQKFSKQTWRGVNVLLVVLQKGKISEYSVQSEPILLINMGIISGIEALLQQYKRRA